MGMVEDWPSSAACRDGDPDALFVQGAEQNAAKRICRGCPVKYECLADALDNRIEFGVWGGMTERERRALLREHPAVESWRRVFAVAMERANEGVESVALQVARPVDGVAPQPGAGDIPPAIPLPRRALEDMPDS